VPDVIAENGAFIWFVCSSWLLLRARFSGRELLLLPGK